MSHARKVVPLAHAATIARQAQADGRTVILCHGCFDIVHPGHLRHLVWAREQGDMLIVSVSGDAAVSNKGVGRPLVPEHLRADNLAALECVDLVVVTPGATAVDTLSAVRPDRYIKGAEYRDSHDPRLAAERDIVQSYGGSLLFSSGDVVYSSTQLIADRAGDWNMHAERLAGFAQRHHQTAGTLRRLVRQAPRLKCLVVGDTIVDDYFHCDATHVAGEAPMLNATLVRRERFWGGAAIVAQHLRGLGAHVTLATPIGRGKASRGLAMACEDNQTDLIPLIHDHSLPRKRRYLAKGAKLLKLDDAPPPAFPAQRVDDFLLSIERAADAWDLVILLDFGYGALAQNTLPRLLATLRPRAHVLLGDVSGPRADLMALKGCDLLCPTENELRTAMRAPSVGLATLAGSLAGQAGARGVIVKLGEDGLVAFDATRRDASDRLLSDFLPSMAHRAVDPLGCGDALLSVAGVSLAVGGSLFDASLLGSVAAAMEAETPGNRPIVLERLVQRLDAEFESIERVRPQVTTARSAAVA